MTYTAPVLGLPAGVVGIADTIPYVRDTVRGSTRPHRGTWLVWSVLAIVACLSQRADGASWSLIMAAAPSSCSRSAVARGASARPTCVVAADFIGAAMMVPKVYRDPGSETLATFALASLSGAMAALIHHRRASKQRASSPARSLS